MPRIKQLRRIWIADMAGVRKWFSSLGITEHGLFLVAVAFKAIDGAMELCAGIILLTLGASYIKYLIWLWTSDELSEEPNNVVAQHVAHAAKHLNPHSKTFAAIYLIFHGVLKLGLVGGMLRRIHWAYPLAAIFLVGFIGYQIYRITEHFSFILLFLTCIDGLIVLIILLEYARLRRSAPAS
jgi:uncharacterized membrane protein